MYHLSKIISLFVDDNGSIEDVELALRVEGDLRVEHQNLGRPAFRRHHVTQVAGVTVLRFWTSVRFLKMKIDEVVVT